jgi:hypothetical protein
LSPLLNKIPGIGETLAPSAGIAAANQLKQPANTTQAIGKGAEQLAEWLLPTGLEEKAGAAVAEHAPQIARWAVPAAKAATAALESGVRNKTQGGSFTAGAATGAAGSVAGPILKKAGSGMAEIAMAPGKRVLKSLPDGVDIGKTVLENSTAFNPAKITTQLGGKIADVDTSLSDLLSTSAAGGTQIPLYSARGKVADELQNAVAKNSPDYIKDVGKLGDQLKYQYAENAKPAMAATGPTSMGAGFMPVPATPKMAPVRLPDYVDPVQARSLKQGIDLSIGNWNPEAQSAIAPLQERVRGSLAGEIHSAVPGSEGLDKQLTNLIPAKDAAWNMAHNPGITAKVLEKLARPTGALTGMFAGGSAGYHAGGTPGALLGGALGLAGGSFVTSPTGEMIAARALASPKTLNSAKGLALQFARPSSLNDR